MFPSEDSWDASPSQYCAAVCGHIISVSSTVAALSLIWGSTYVAAGQDYLSPLGASYSRGWPQNPFYLNGSASIFWLGCSLSISRAQRRGQPAMDAAAGRQSDGGSRRRRLARFLRLVARAVLHHRGAQLATAADRQWRPDALGDRGRSLRTGGRA